jgi:hypothetical protein
MNGIEVVTSVTDVDTLGEGIGDKTTWGVAWRNTFNSVRFRTIGMNPLLG